MIFRKSEKIYNCGQLTLEWSFEKYIKNLIPRIVAGLSEGNISICLAALADIKDQKAKSKGMAMIGVAYSIGKFFYKIIIMKFYRKKIFNF